MGKTLPITSRAKTTALKQPKELFTYTRDIEGEYHYNANQSHDHLPYFYLPDSKVDNRIDLQSGFKNFKKISEEANMSDFEPLLNAIMQYERDEVEDKVEGDIITFRGIMTRLMSIPYSPADALDLVIVPFDGQLFINFNTEVELKRRKEQDDRTRQTSPREKYEYIKKCEYSGYKFETIATIPQPWKDVSRKYIDSRHKKPVNNYEQFLSVIKTGIGPVKLVLAGEVDCCWDYVPERTSNSLSHYVELKTSKVIDSNNQLLNFEKKLFKTWCQCFLMGVGKVVYGFRDDQFVLRNVEIYQTEEIPVLIKENPLNSLKQNQATKVNCTSALKWYGAVVEWLNGAIDKNDESISYNLKYDPVKKILSLSETSQEFNGRLRNGGLLVEEFKKWRDEKKK
ncbi:RAI1 [Candida theae]|uniref:Decapping nuclease n=1 Tax=Candida theae TaxID=1198502 RepID=A0AAD5BEZ3_9ASCO|nr:RAI1 [Candida theae]KAI5957939.1 RAI1 [Candida theae]